MTKNKSSKGAMPQQSFGELLPLNRSTFKMKALDLAEWIKRGAGPIDVDTLQRRMCLFRDIPKQFNLACPVSYPVRQGKHIVIRAEFGGRILNANIEPHRGADWVEARITIARYFQDWAETIGDDSAKPAEPAATIEGESSHQVPPEYRTRPISITEAGVRAGFEGRNRDRKKRRDAGRSAMGRAMKGGGFLFEQVGPRLYVFDVRQVPEPKKPK